MKEKAETPVRVRETVAAIPPYKQGAMPKNGGYKLSSNENPFPPLPEVLQAATANLGFNRYGGEHAQLLRDRLADRFAVTADHIHLAAGSAGILFQLVHAVAQHGDNYVYPWPSFEAYPMLGVACGATPIGVPLTEDGRHRLHAMAQAVNENTRAIILCTPNNPTGPSLTRQEFDRFMTEIPADTLVVLDEAYYEFQEQHDCVRGEDVLKHHPNLVVLRTFSKAHGLAGLRIGYSVSHPEIASLANKMAVPLSLTEPALAAALAVMQPETQKKSLDRVKILCERRDALAAQLRALNLKIPESQANYVWISEHSAGPGGAEALGNALNKRNILTRVFTGTGVRISVGEAESVPAIVETVRAHLDK